jgi:hypothetical protein
MKAPNIAPAYVTLYPGMCEVARSCGYALALHGSMITDMDCIAVAWTDDAVSHDDLLAKFDQYIKLLFPESVLTQPTLKPHGRTAWAFNIGNGAQIDLSVVAPKHDSLSYEERFCECGAQDCWGEEELASNRCAACGGTIDA